MGLVFYYLFSILLGMGKIGLLLIVLFAAIGYGITTLKVPENSTVPFLRKIGGERLDDVILRAIKFKAKGKRIYIYTKEENKK